MAKLPILLYPSPVIRKKSRLITSIDGELQRFIDDMVETMYAAPVLARVAEIRNHRADALGRSALERIDHDQQLHQVVIGRRAGRLHHEHVARAHVLLDLDVDLAVREAPDARGADGYAQVARDLGREVRIGVAGEDEEIRMMSLHERTGG